jgi:nitroreductase
MDFRTLASTRRSIRKYTQDDIGTDEIVECIKTAVTAPSGCNSQCWKFVVVHEKAVVDKLAEAVSAAVVKTAGELGLDDDAAYVEGKIRMTTFFRNAPILVAVFMTKLDYYDARMEAGYIRKGYSGAAIMEALSNPDILSIGAVIQNLLLAVHEKGYGACWMNEPILAKEEISKILGASADMKLMSLIPIGRPAYAPKGKTYKPIANIVDIIE